MDSIDLAELARIDLEASRDERDSKRISQERERQDIGGAVNFASSFMNSGASSSAMSQLFQRK